MISYYSNRKKSIKEISLNSIKNKSANSSLLSSNKLNWKLKQLNNAHYKSMYFFYYKIERTEITQNEINSTLKSSHQPIINCQVKLYGTNLSQKRNP